MSEAAGPGSTDGPGSSSRPGTQSRLPRFPASRDPRPDARLVVLGLGSNRDAEAQIRRAIDRISYRYHLLVKSTRYVGPPENAPEGEREQATPYSNASALIRTADHYTELRTTFRALEEELGRDRSTPDVVAIDIDILLIDGEVVRNEGGAIVVPHPDLETKRHAAIPSSEVAPGLLHPRSKETIAAIAARLA